MTIKVYGVGISPYVRKVRLALAYKGLDYDLIPVIPSAAELPPEFVQNSPLGKIPLVSVDDTWVPDSSVILAYLERARSDTPLLSSDPKLAARALWFEAYVDSKMNSVIGGHLFAELVLAPHFFKRESNLEEIELAKSTEIPEIFDYLESQLCADYLLGDQLGHADVCMTGSFITLNHCDFVCEASRWPKTAAYIDRLMAEPAFASILDDEKALLKSVM